MADDLEKKPQNTKEIKQGEKVVKTISSDKSSGPATPPPKTKAVLFLFIFAPYINFIGNLMTLLVKL